MACLGIAMDPCRLYPSFHVRLRTPHLGLLLRRHHNDKPLLPLGRSYPQSLDVFRGRKLMDVVVVCKLSSGHDGHRNVREHDTQGKQQHQKLPESTYNNRHTSDQRKKKLLRLRGRLRLMLRNLRQWWSLRASVMRSKVLAVPILLGCTVALGCLCLKLTSVPAPHSVPYSELVMHLKSGTVTSALFEEGSRQVFFNVHPSHNSLDNEAAGCTNSESVAVVDISQDDPSISNVKSTSFAGESEQKIEFDYKEQTAAEKYKSLGKRFTVILTNCGMSALSAMNSSLEGISGAPEKLTRREPHLWQYSSRRVENDEPYLLQLMRDNGVTYGSAPQPMSTALRTTLITIISLWIPLTPLLWMMYKHISGSNSLSQKRRLSKPNVKFDDVAGVEEAKAELVEIVSYLQGAANFKMLGAKLPKGVLLVGPPGTGKTLLARAVAGEAGVPFFSASASEFVEMFVGRGAARIRDLFSGARKCSPSIIFIDELDAVGGRRGRSFNDERDQTLNQLLTEMDGFEADTGVLVIAATNRPEALDPALCRSGRFSRKVFVKEPDLKGRQQILAVHLRDVPVEGEMVAVQSTIASITPGFVGADLACVVNEATLLAIRAGRLAVTIEDLKEAVSRVKYGVGNRPAFSTTVERMFDWLQPKSLKSNPLGYEAPSWSG